ncbi:DUF1292 domain-containing protein [Paenibacillus contaminans]|jgi:uncharacterized protein YrzB (UPF0473 family)|uniref:DUF1292 domain-containing protein n=1 Tax=Paenibacillus contaminans TaxID=450362 RepID=A0A329MJN7_9BACL|nr:DUF1292 domain-containing protein [Paenibacillus contaminans]RAV19862.1 DUF1292 domain-containing protein [Paenibacillus contaminans]
MSEHKHDDDCGCGHDHEHEDDVFLVTDADGVEREMVIVYTFESESKAYAVLLDRNAPEADGVIFRVDEEDGEAYLTNIEDEQEWERVVEIYNRIAEEEAQQ